MPNTSVPDFPVPNGTVGQERCVGSGRADPSSAQQLVVLSGISGGGKTTAMKAFEDIGFEAIDNPPFPMLLPLLQNPPAARVVIGVDARTRGLDIEALLAARDSVRAQGNIAMGVVYLDCEEDVALRRFKETRRKHPLAADGSPREGLAIERTMLQRLRAEADHVLDTSLLSPRELKRWVAGVFAADDPAGLIVQVISFSYRHGLPREADLVFDVRFLSNPHYNETLRPLTGRELEVGRFIEADPGTATFLEALERLLSFAVPRYEQEGKSYLTIAIGCTGGRHRSVYIAERVAKMLQSEGWPTGTSHRDIDGERAVMHRRY